MKEIFLIPLFVIFYIPAHASTATTLANASRPEPGFQQPNLTPALRQLFDYLREQQSEPTEPTAATFLAPPAVVHISLQLAQISPTFAQSARINKP